MLVKQLNRLRVKANEAFFLLRDATVCLDDPIKYRLGLSFAEIAVIRFHDNWCYFCKELILLSASGRATTYNGVILKKPKGINSFSDIKRILINEAPKMRNGPNWAITDQCINAAKKLNIENYQAISLSFGATGSPSDDLRIVRNFFVHKSSKEAALKIKSASWYRPHMKLCVEDILFRRMLGGDFVVNFWIDRLLLIAQLAIQ